jgi:hypothetical protein
VNVVGHQLVDIVRDQGSFGIEVSYLDDRDVSGSFAGTGVSARGSRFLLWLMRAFAISTHARRAAMAIAHFKVGTASILILPSRNAVGMSVLETVD